MVSFPPPGRYEAKLGDFVGKAGIYTKPGVVTARNEDGTVVIDTNPEEIKKFHRHSNTTGLEVADKERFNEIMDEVMNEKDNAMRVDMLQANIDELKTDAANKKLVEYLTNEQSMLIRHARELPRVYTYESSKLYR